jgi:hypothetical protein
MDFLFNTADLKCPFCLNPLSDSIPGEKNLSDMPG